MSFRISSELETLASAAASAAGDKNASAWCQRLAVEALMKISEANQNEIAGKSSEPASAEDLLHALNNIRQFNLDCFKLSLKNEEQYKEFLNIVIASEEEWEIINQSIAKSEPKSSPAANKSTDAIKNFAGSEIPGKEDRSSEEQTAAFSNEYLSFAEEMQNEVAELVGDGQKFIVSRNNQATGFGEDAAKSQILPVLPTLDTPEQMDAGRRFWKRLNRKIFRQMIGQ